MNNLLTRKQLEEALQASEAHIVRLEKEGMPVIRIGKRSPRYDLEQVKQWIADMNRLADDKS